MLNLAAVDPGGETGVACACLPFPLRDPPHVAVRKAIVAGRGLVTQVYGDFNSQVVEIGDILEGRLKRSGYGRQQAYEVQNHIAIEGFRLHPKANLQDSALQPVRVGAKLEFYLWLDNAPWELRWQQPSEMNAVPDAALRRWKMWMPGKDNDDARAALKHLVVLTRSVSEELRKHG